MFAYVANSQLWIAMLNTPVVSKTPMFKLGVHRGFLVSFKSRTPMVFEVAS